MDKALNAMNSTEQKEIDDKHSFMRSSLVRGGATEGGMISPSEERTDHRWISMNVKSFPNANLVLGNYN